MRKKILCIILALISALCLVPSYAAEKVLTGEDVKFTDGITHSSDGITWLNAGRYFGFDNVELTGINSIEVKVKSSIPDRSNGETLAIMADDPYQGVHIGNVAIGKNGEYSIKAAIKEQKGTHKLYFYCLYGSGLSNTLKIMSVTLKPEKLTKTDDKVPDSLVRDAYTDTWALTDSLGRKAADFEETGPVKSGRREVGIGFWNWHTDNYGTNAVVIPEFLAAHPEAKDSYSDKNWDNSGYFYWGRPVFGFYNSSDYWVYTRQAELLGAAGVDAVFLDYTNGGFTYLPMLSVMADAFRDVKRKGIKVPKISCFTGRDTESMTRLAESIYFYCFNENDYSDIWYYRDGKPFIMGSSFNGTLLYDNVTSYTKTLKNTYASSLGDKVGSFFSNRTAGMRNNDTEGWQWLEAFPQMLRGKGEGGRPEFVTVGAAINQTPYTKKGSYDVFSNPDSKSRGFSEVFGEDNSLHGIRMGYFFREQASLALEADPEFVFAGQWNEWTAVRNENFNGYKNSFVDTYDYAKSRDAEPNDGPLKDDYYVMLSDFVRKYKGVRKTPVLSGAKTVDISGDVSQWDSVGPEFFNASSGFSRDSYGFKDTGTNEKFHYVTKVNNNITLSKVTFDEENVYFMAQCENDIKRGDNFMNLYINSDRNYATGYEGYDLSVNLKGEGVISKRTADSWADSGEAKMNISGKTLVLSLPRDLFPDGSLDFEFKWTDSVDISGDFMKIYSVGTAAPIARFNYVATEKEEKALSTDEKKALAGTSVLKAGCEKMVVSGSEMSVYEADRRVTPFEANGTLYVPAEAFCEIMGYGRSKWEYNPDRDIFYTYWFELSDDLSEVTDYLWTYSAMGSAEARVNGVLTTLKAPVTAVDSVIYFPVSMLYDCYGLNVTKLSDDVYAIGNGSAAENALSLLE